MASRPTGEDSEPRWLTRVKRAGDAATSLQSVVVLGVLVAGSLGTLVLRNLDGDDDPVAGGGAEIAIAGERTEQNVPLAEQLGQPGNLTIPKDTERSRVLGDVHAVRVTVAKSDDCGITWRVVDADTNSSLPPSTVVEERQACRTSGSFHQDVWVPNPDGVDAYFLRFYLVDGDGNEMARARTGRYELG